MNIQEVIRKLEEKANDIKYGKIKVEYVVSRGKIVKIVITKTEECLLLDKL